MISLAISLSLALFLSLSLPLAILLQLLKRSSNPTSPHFLQLTPTMGPTQQTLTPDTERTRMDLIDPEGAREDDAYLYNDSISSCTWNDLNVYVKDRTTKQDRKILDGVTGVARAGERGFGTQTTCKALRPVSGGANNSVPLAYTKHTGEMLALMGPSGSGKTTLLNFLAQRASAAALRTEGELLVDGVVRKGRDFKAISSYVEQEDALIGSLTVKETIEFAAKMATTRYVQGAVF